MRFQVSPNFIFLWCRQPLGLVLGRHTVLELLSKSQHCPQPLGMEFASSLPLLALLACALLFLGPAWSGTAIKKYSLYVLKGLQTLPWCSVRVGRVVLL